MFDLSTAIAYRGVALNSADRVAAGGRLSGALVESITWAGVRGVGYLEKRSQGDGDDSSDVYLAPRRLILRGTVYGETRGETYDKLNEIVAAFTPTLAYDDDADNYGFLPLSGSRPTDETGDFASGTIDLFINVRPVAQPSFTLNRDTMGSNDDLGFGVQYEVELHARDPRLYVSTVVEVDLSGTNGGSGTLVNRGTYSSPLSIILVSSTSAPQDFRLVGMNMDVTLTVPDLSGCSCTVEFDGDSKITTLTYLGNETLRTDLIDMASETGYPMVPPDGGAYTWTLSVGTVLLTGSKLRYYEAFA